ncbi:MAG TPA: glycosyltransferase [Bacteroidota bacterium]|nr:glycosyltransferase [Bacteroidota bacterium]
MSTGNHLPIAISVIIPAYQEGTRLTRILGQIPPSLRRSHGIEVIVSDGGSTDETVACARAGADTVVENPDGHRQTIGEGRNRGADLARGMILVFLNADVTLESPGDFFKGVAAAFAGKHVAAATCRVMVEPAEETPFDRRFHTLFNAWCRLLTALGFGMARGECQAVSAELFRKVGGYNEALAAAEDYDLFRRIIRKGRIRFMAGVTVFESPRRYRTLGYPRVLSLWFMNALSVTFRGRSKSREWTAVR